MDEIHVEFNVKYDEELNKSSHAKNKQKFSQKTRISESAVTGEGQLREISFSHKSSLHLCFFTFYKARNITLMNCYKQAL